MNKKKVAIIGAGFTGLAAAYDLAKAGVEVVIYERTDYAGGLASGFRLDDGTPLEKAYHFLYKTDSHIINLSNELGIGDKLHFHKSSIGAYYKGQLYPFMTPIDLLKFRPLSLVQKVRTGMVAVYLQRVRNREPLTRVSALSWLNRYNGKKATTILWEPLLRGKFSKYYDQVTMAWLHGRIWQRQTSKNKGEATERLGYFEGGFQTLVNALTNNLSKKSVQFLYNQNITSISSTSDQKVTVTANGASQIYDAVLSTLPSPVFANLIKEDQKISSSYLTKLNSIDYLGAVIMVITLKKPISDYYWHQIHDLDAPFLVLLSLTNLAGVTDKHGNHIYYIGDYLPNDDPFFNKTDQQIADVWLSGLQQMSARFDKADVVEQHVFRFKNAQHIVDVGFEQKIVDFQSPIENLYLANFSQIYPEDRGTNFAVRDGRRVAKDILKSFGMLE